MNFSEIKKKNITYTLINPNLQNIGKGNFTLQSNSTNTNLCFNIEIQANDFATKSLPRVIIEDGQKKIFTDLVSGLSLYLVNHTKL